MCLLSNISYSWSWRHLALHILHLTSLEHVHNASPRGHAHRLRHQEQVRGHGATSRFHSVTETTSRAACKKIKLSAETVLDRLRLRFKDALIVVDCTFDPMVELKILSKCSINHISIPELVFH